MEKRKWLSLVLAGVMSLNLAGIMPASVKAEGGVDVTYPTVYSYETTNGEFSLSDASRICIVSSNETMENEILQNDLKLMSSEFSAKNLTEESMEIVYGTMNTAKTGDIVVSMADVEGIDSEEEYMIEVGDYAKVTAPNESGIFYGIRTIQKALLVNNGVMDKGTIKDYPAVKVRSFHLDNARRNFSKDWIIKMVKELSWQNFNTLQFHFSENEGYRLESSTLEAVSGFRYPSDGYLTKEDMLDIIEVCQQYHIELVPSLDSPGHMTYVLNFLPDEYSCKSLWPSDFRSEQCFNIFEVPEAKQILVDLFTEYAEFFSEAGCKHINIGGDEFLNNFGSMTSDQYKIVIDYFNEISALVKRYGMIPRVWNDGVMYGDYTGYTLDSDIEVCYWSGPNKSASVEKFKNNGNNVINFSDVYMYYVLSPWWMSNANPSAKKIFEEWHPGKMPTLTGNVSQDFEYPYTDDALLGASFAVWCDMPNYNGWSDDTISDNVFLRSRAMAEKTWNPGTKKSYSEFETVVNTLGNVAGYGTTLPAPGEITYAGELGKVKVTYLDEKGNEIKDALTMYGILDDAYRVIIEDIYGYEYISANGKTEGIYDGNEVNVTLIYRMVTDKTELQMEIENELNEEQYITETFSDYKVAIQEAKQVFENESANQTLVDNALKAVTTAKEKVVGLEKYALYTEAQYPYSEAGFVGGYAAYRAAVDEAKEVLADQEASTEQIETTLHKLLEAKAALQKPDEIVPTITATQDYYQTNSYTNMIDNNLNTKAWFENHQIVGDEILFTFPQIMQMTSVQVVQPTDVGADILKNADVRVSSDKQNWTTIGNLNPDGGVDVTFTFEKKEVKYVQIIIKEGKEKWYQISEVRFTYEQPEEDTTLSLLMEEARSLDMNQAPASKFSDLADAMIAAQKKLILGASDMGEEETALRAAIDAIKNYVPATLKEIIVKAPVKTLYKIGEKLDLTGMTVTANYSDGTTKDVTKEAGKDTGKFDSEKAGTYTILVSYEGKTASFDVTVEETEVPPVEEVNKEALKKAIQEAENLQEADYTEDTWKAFTKALEAAKKVAENKEAKQKDVDDAVKVLDTAKDALKPKEENPMPEPPVKLPFTDVRGGEDVENPDWYYDAVYDVYTKKLMTGMKETYFGAGEMIARGQFAVILYRMEQEPEVTFEEKFPDVKEGDFFAKAVTWAEKTGIITGYKHNGYFGPADFITREQMATMMYRYAEYKGINLNKSLELDQFPDGGKVQEFAVTPMKWCVAEGLITGKGKETETKKLDPQGNANRAECATIISRYVALCK